MICSKIINCNLSLSLFSLFPYLCIADFACDANTMSYKIILWFFSRCMHTWYPYILDSIYELDAVAMHNEYFNLSHFKDRRLNFQFTMKFTITYDIYLIYLNWKYVFYLSFQRWFWYDREVQTLCWFLNLQLIFKFGRKHS